MPVYLETIAAPSTQDRTDLGKIFADAPAWLLAPYGSAEDLIEAGLKAGQLIGGRFNDRLLGAALLQRGEQTWRLSHLCVRRITRQRGVGQRLLDEAQRLAREAGKPLHLAAPLEQLEAQALAARTHLPLEAL